MPGDDGDDSMMPIPPHSSTVLGVTGTAPIASSGGATPAISLNDTAVTPASYTNTSLTVDAKGRLTAASNGVATVVDEITCVFDGGGSTPAINTQAWVEVAFACTINRATMMLDQSGSAVIDVWKDAYANYPPTVADTITASAKPTVSSATKSQDSTLTGWTTSIAAGDILKFNLDSVTTATKIVLTLKVTRT